MMTLMILLIQLGLPPVEAESLHQQLWTLFQSQEGRVHAAQEAILASAEPHGALMAGWSGAFSQEAGIGGGAQGSGERELSLALELRNKKQRSASRAHLGIAREQLALGKRQAFLTFAGQQIDQMLEVHRLNRLMDSWRSLEEGWSQLAVKAKEAQKQGLLSDHVAVLMELSAVRARVRRQEWALKQREALKVLSQGQGVVSDPWLLPLDPEGYSWVLDWNPYELMAAHPEWDQAQWALQPALADNALRRQSLEAERSLRFSPQIHWKEGEDGADWLGASVSWQWASMEAQKNERLSLTLEQSALEMQQQLRRQRFRQRLEAQREQFAAASCWFHEQLLPLDAQMEAECQRLRQGVARQQVTQEALLQQEQMWLDQRQLTLSTGFDLLSQQLNAMVLMAQMND
jgi:hypothetical protein